jgi:hypothetical protein
VKESLSEIGGDDFISHQSRQPVESSLVLSAARFSKSGVQQVNVKQRKALGASIGC